MLKVLGIGDNVCDIYLHTGMMYPGGQALNFTVYARQLGAESAYIGVFGTDAVAEHVQTTLREIKVAFDRCRVYEGENGYAKVSLVNGERIFVMSNKGGVLREHPIELDGEDLSYIRKFDLIHTSNNSYMDSQLTRLYDSGVPVSYDFSNSWKDWTRTERVCPYIAVGFLSGHTMDKEEAGQICQRMHRLGCKVVVMTTGSEGAWFSNEEIKLFQAPNLVVPVDTLGAGDSFAARFLIFVTEAAKSKGCKLNELKPEEYKKALSEASAFAARTCMVRGAFGHGKKCPVHFE